MFKVLDYDLQIPVIITKKDKKCDLFIPDLDITVHGHDYVDTLANSILKASAIYFYNLERNLKFELTTTFVEASEMCDDKDSFVTYITLVA